jgi:hypothetical protein
MKRAAVILSLVLAGSIATSASASKPRDPQCSLPDSVTVGTPYTVVASGLPSGGPLNMVVVYPNGITETTPITATDGSYVLQASAEDAGAYTYEFVAKVSWPSGQTNKVYATCSMRASSIS